MYRQGTAWSSRILAIALAAAISGTVHAQSETIDVTLEVIDDVSEIDAVVMRLEEARSRDEDRDRSADENRRRDELERSVRDAADAREGREQEVATERDLRRELQNEEEDLEVDFERERQAAEPERAVDEPR